MIALTTDLSKFLIFVIGVDITRLKNAHFLDLLLTIKNATMT